MPSFALLAAFLLSGMSGLIYEVIWTRQLALLVGATAIASQAVLAAFFAGFTAGGFFLGRRLARAPDGAQAYARLELAIAAAGIFSAALLAILRAPAAHLTTGSDGPRTAAVALAITFFSCFPATFLMGATLPALARALESTRPGTATKLLGRAYATNTAGGVIGAVGGAFFLLPALGARGSLAVAVAGNLAAAALARRPVARLASAGDGEDADRPLPPDLAAALALAGFAAIALEIVGLRVMAASLQDTVYTFALAVAAYVTGVAVTAAVFGLRAKAAPNAATTTALMMLLAAAWLPTLRLAQPLMRALFDAQGGFGHFVAVEGLITFLLVAPSAFPTTWLFLTLTAQPAAGSPPRAAGRAVAWNGLGCLLAPIVAALVLLPHGGTWGLGVAAVLALALAAVVLGRGAPTRRRLTFAALLAVAGLLLISVRSGLFEWTVTPGWRLIFAREGAAASVSIEESPGGLRRLRTNNSFTEGGDGAMASQARHGLLSTLFSPQVSHGLVLGVGSGGTVAGVVAGMPAARVDAVELLPEIGRAVRLFGRSNGRVADRPGVRLEMADARTFVAAAAARGDRYDLVTGDLFHTTQAGMGALYAREHFQNVRGLLGQDGRYCQWIPLHETPTSQVRVLVRTFFHVFSEGAVLFGGWTLRTPTLGLVGSVSPLHLDLDELAGRLSTPPLRAQWAHGAEIDRIAETAAAVMASRQAMLAWAGQGPENTDDHPTLELQAPRERSAYTGPQNALAMLEIWQAPDGIVTYSSGVSRERVVATQAAAAAFIRGTWAWIGGDLGQAERELQQGWLAAPGTSFVGEALEQLTEAWKEGRRPERAHALQAWRTAQGAAR